MRINIYEIFKLIKEHVDFPCIITAQYDEPNVVFIVQVRNYEAQLFIYPDRPVDASRVIIWCRDINDTIKSINLDPGA